MGPLEKLLARLRQLIGALTEHIANSLQDEIACFSDIWLLLVWRLKVLPPGARDE